MSDEGRRWNFACILFVVCSDTLSCWQEIASQKGRYHIGTWVEVHTVEGAPSPQPKKKSAPFQRQKEMSSSDRSIMAIFASAQAKIPSLACKSLYRYLARRCSIIDWRARNQRCHYAPCPILCCVYTYDFHLHSILTPITEKTLLTHEIK